jgi:hypothetical protein
MKVSATMSAQPETTETVARKSKQVSTTVSLEKYAALEDYRWSNRVNKLSDVITEAVDLFLETKAKEASAKPAK